MKVKVNLIKEARINKGFSQEYLAEVLGISQSHYCNLEKGVTNFNISQLGLLLDLLNLNPLEVIEFSEKQQVFINSSYSGNYNTNITLVDKNIIREIIKEELKK